MYSLGAFFGTMVVQLPILAVLIGGLVLLSTSTGRRLPPRAALFGRAGLIVLLVSSFGALSWSIILPQLITGLDFKVSTVRNYGLASAAVSFLLSILSAAGIGLLIAALLSAARPADGPPGSVEG